MNILVLHRYPIDLAIGTNPSFPYMLERLYNFADDVTLISFKGNTKNKFPKIKFKELRFSFDRGNSIDKLFKSILWLFLSPLVARSVAKKNNIDLIYCDDSIPYYPYFIKILVGKKTKVVMRLGDLQTGYFFADQGFIKKIFFHVFHYFELVAWRKIDWIIAISNPFRKYVEKEGIDPNKIFVVKESINLDSFYPMTSRMREQYNIEDNAIVIMFHGAIEKSKGVEVLLDAAQKIMPKHNELYLLIVGNGTAFNEIRNKGEQGRYKDRIIFTGWVELNKIPEFLNAADIGIALRNENIGNNFVVTTALMQYWACEKPLLAPDLAAIQEIVVDGENAILFKKGNSDDLAEKIDEIIKNRDRWQSMGKLGRKTVRENFDKTKVAQDMVDLLSQFAILQD